MKRPLRFALVGAALLLNACSQDALPGDTASAQGDAVAHPEIWPKYEYPVPVDPAVEAKIADLLKTMTLEDKIGQLIQADLCCVTPEEVREYNLGSILVGGNSGPNGNDFAPAPDWLKAADAFYLASVDKRDGGAGIPVIWGIDAVHGHANIIGATVFPHNIGLGAAHDPALIERIGAATAQEVRVTGQEWTFAPTVTVPQDYRWGRAYEGYSSDPKLVASYVGAMVRGLQGPPDQANLLARDKVIASTKHFLADGGTKDGVDQGDAQISEEDLRDIHGLPYGPAIENGVATVMVSFSSWQGKKLTGNKSLITDVLKDRMGFGGFVVSDWNAHGQVEGCTNSACPQALLAGLDMYMAPDSWKAIYEDLLRRAKAGEIPMQRIDDAVSRILRVKFRLGVFEAGKPSSRPLAGDWKVLGSPQHRELAREAVRKSLVLLKNQGVLPLKAGARLLVAGEGADDVARASGGWTISWQGTGLTNAMFPGSTSLWAGLKQAAEAGGGSATLSPDGSFSEKPDAAVVVFGEKPYAEFQGDRATLALDADLTGPYATMKKLRAQGIPVVAVMITGRPLYVNPALNAADAFVVAWLPGSEGGKGLADVLIGDAAGKTRFDFTGKLPAAWPKTPAMADGALFPFGYGLTYAAPRAAWKPLPEIADSKAGDARIYFARGVPTASWSLVLGNIDRAEEKRITTVPADAIGGRAHITATDAAVQEGARRIEVKDGGAALAVSSHDPLDLGRETNADVMVLFTVKVNKAPARAAVALRCEGSGCGSREPVTLPASGTFVRYGIPLKCLASKGADMSKVTAPFILETTGPADYALAEVRLGTDAEKVLPCN
ncbi:glycoside hydrolase family 3 protein [Croceibacterium aestuarii]|uniref:glycoside hydrolase family 3 protein n=1 Tax=Croceibacterium aestuarii TaxID=3064139 RepID=UPI00272E8B7B|nr:glycoside hydrolase family 3 protein [Croceibacterium sp. D39]